MLDDLLELRTGDQVPADGVVRSADGLEIDESLLTGESDPVDKPVDAEVLSGSIVVAGSGRVPGDRGRRRRVRPQARRPRRAGSRSPARSSSTASTDPALRHPVRARPDRRAAARGASSATTTVSDAMTSTVAGVVGMVPEGLVLLTSLAFGVAAVTLARRNVLVQELPAVEGLARVDVVCLDKTGTLTEGDVVFDRLELLDRLRRGRGPRRAGRARRRHERATRRSGRSAPRSRRPRAGPEPGRSRSRRPASGARRRFGDHGTWVLGAPEMVLADARRRPGAPPGRRARAQGRRVLLLAARRRRAGGRDPAGGLARRRARAARREGPARRARDACVTSTSRAWRSR